MGSWSVTEWSSHCWSWTVVHTLSLPAQCSPELHKPVPIGHSTLPSHLIPALPVLCLLTEIWDDPSLDSRQLSSKTACSDGKRRDSQHVASLAMWKSQVHTMFSALSDISIYIKGSNDTHYHSCECILHAKWGTSVLQDLYTVYILLCIILMAITLSWFDSYDIV